MHFTFYQTYIHYVYWLLVVQVYSQYCNRVTEYKICQINRELAVANCLPT